MAEYIDREAIIANLIEQIENGRDTAECEATELVIKRFAEYIKRFPAADVQSVNQFISVEKRVPDVSGNYLCYLATGDMEVVYFDREIEDDEYNNDFSFGLWNTYPSDDGGECREWIEIMEVTHWQPLPKPPKDGDTE